MSDELRLVVSKRQLKVFLAAAVVLGAVHAIRSETITLTTLYPSPSGVYKKLVTTLDTILARDGGNVGIGTDSPQAKLDVRGPVRIMDGNQGAGKVLTSDANGNTSWQTSAAAAPPIVCKTVRAVGNQNYTGYTFAASECSPGYPDATYVGMAAHVGICNGFVRFMVINAGQTDGGIINGPGLSMWGNFCYSAAAPFVAEVVYVKRAPPPAAPKSYTCGTCTIMVRECADWSADGCDNKLTAKTFGGSGTCTEPTSTYSTMSCTPAPYSSSGKSCGQLKTTSLQCTATNTPVE